LSFSQEATCSIAQRTSQKSYRNSEEFKEREIILMRVICMASIFVFSYGVDSWSRLSLGGSWASFAASQATEKGGKGFASDISTTLEKADRA